MKSSIIIYFQCEQYFVIIYQNVKQKCERVIIKMLIHICDNDRYPQLEVFSFFFDQSTTGSLIQSFLNNSIGSVWTTIRNHIDICYVCFI